MGVISARAIERVRGDEPWRFKVALDRQSDGTPFPFPDGWEVRAQLRTPDGIIDLGAPVEAAPELGTAVFEIGPEDYAAVPDGQLTRFSWWLTNGVTEETQGIFPLRVIER